MFVPMATIPNTYITLKSRPFIYSALHAITRKQRKDLGHSHIRSPHLQHQQLFLKFSLIKKKKLSHLYRIRTAKGDTQTFDAKANSK